MTNEEWDARLAIMLAMGVTMSTINVTGKLVPTARTEMIHEFVSCLRASADAIEAQARIIDGTAIDDIIERSKQG